MDLINVDKLNSLRIHELRDFARKVGVQSPTSKKKNKLITDILSILKGESEPYVNKTKQGRPVKSAGFAVEDVYNMLLTDEVLTSGFDEIDYDVSYDFGGKHSFFVNSPTISFNEELERENKNKKQNLVNINGFLDIHKQGYGVVRVNGFAPSKKDVYVQPSLITNYNLKNGDIIKGNATLPSGNRPKVLVEILEINYESVKDKNRYTGEITSFYDYEYLPLDKNLFGEFSNGGLRSSQEFYEGSRNFIYNTNFTYETQIEYSETLASAGYKVFGLYLNAMPEHKSVIKHNIVLDCIPFNTNEKGVVMATNMLIKSASRALEMGYKVIIIVNNFSRLVNAVNTEESNIYERALKKETTHYVKNFLSYAKNAKNNRSITIFVADDLLVEQELLDFYKFDLFKFFNTLNEVDKNGNIIKYNPKN